MRSLPRIGVVLSLVLATGCAPQTPESTAEESDTAMETLTTALDAWKLGAVDGLARRDPAIRFDDDDCLAGWHLTGYELETPDIAIQPYENVRVNLTLRDPRGNAVERMVGYQVSLTPVPSVLRSEP